MRYQRLDALRGGALIGMILFHINYIVENVFGDFSLHFSDTFWFILGRSVAILFIVVSGVSFFLSARKKNIPKLTKDATERFIILGSLALLITAVTYTFFYEQRISFGIIHFFALASLGGLLFVRLGSLNVIIGTALVILGYFLRYFDPDTYLLIPLGLYPSDFYSADYYPIVPWFGYYLIGYGGAYWLHQRELFDHLFGGSSVGGAILAYAGRHSLLLYIIHVPIVYAVLTIIYSL